VEGPAYKSAYASYAVEDQDDVRVRTDAISQLTGISFFMECLSVKPSEDRKTFLKKRIAGSDTFMLFWSPCAATSNAVTWEWKTALERPGLGAMSAQRLEQTPLLPAQLEDLGLPKEPPMSGRQIDRRFFVVGSVLAVFVAVMVVWSFAKGSLTGDQRTILRVLLSLASGFVVGSFIGGVTVKTKGIVPGIVGTATGGFAVWLLTAFAIVPKGEMFTVVVRPYGPGGTLDTLPSGRVTIDIAGDPRSGELQNGQVYFGGIPPEFDGKAVQVRVVAPGFEMAQKDTTITLAPGHALPVQMTPTLRGSAP
jgi:hypothetical protein